MRTAEETEGVKKLEETLEWEEPGYVPELSMLDIGQGNPSRSSRPSLHSCLFFGITRSRDVLIDQDRVSIGVQEEQVRHASPRFISLLHDLNSALLERALDVTHVVEFRRVVARGAPTRIEG